MALDQGENDQTGRVGLVSTAFDSAGFANNTSLAQAGFRAKDAKMNASDIKDEKSLRQWLETRPLADSKTIAHRAALRVIPVWGAQMGYELPRVGDWTTLPILRLNLSSGVIRKYLTTEVSAALLSAETSAFAGNDAADAALSVGAEEANAAITAAIAIANYYATSSPAFSIVSLAASAGAAAAALPVGTGRSTMWAIFRADCMMLDQDRTLDGSALWPNGENLLKDAWSKTQSQWIAERSTYSFWLRWYEAALEGNHLNLELERDIALIPDADWQKGAEHIAGLIALIEERYDLKAQVQALRKQLTPAQIVAANSAHRGHNGPPELIEDQAEAQRQITIIFDTRDKAEVELSQAAPSPSRLKRIGQALVNAGLVIAKYCGGLGNTMLQNAAEELGTSGAKWALRIGAASLAAETTISLGKSLINFAEKLFAGS